MEDAVQRLQAFHGVHRRFRCRPRCCPTLRPTLARVPQVTRFGGHSNLALRCNAALPTTTVHFESACATSTNVRHFDHITQQINQPRQNHTVAEVHQLPGGYCAMRS